MKNLLIAAFFSFAPLLGHAAQTTQIAQAKAAQVDINRASADELKKLKGIGDARAEAIIKARPYKRKDELVQRNIIPQSVYDQIKDQIVARQ
jgi:DNA uptake protein ComE-like DNA-binding protein